MPLGAARTAQYANFWSTGVGMPVDFAVDFAAPGGFAHYAWPLTASSSQVAMLNNGNWAFTTTSAPTTWGSLFACMIYIPTGYFSSLSGNDALTFFSSTQFFDAYGTGSWTSNQGFLQLYKNQTSDTFWQIRAGGGGNNSNENLTAAQTTALEGQWIAVIHSMYDSTTNYTSWTGGSGTGSFTIYNRLVFANAATGALINKFDFRTEYNSSNEEPMKSSYKGRSNFVTNGPVAGVPGIDIKFMSQFVGNTNLKAVNWWFLMGSTQDPSSVYGDYCAQGTWASSETPYAYLPVRDSADWVNKTTFYRPTVTAASRFQGSGGAESSFETSTATPTPTLVYI